MIVQTCFAVIQKSPLVILIGNQDAQKYVKILEDSFLSFGKDVRIDWKFLHDRASCLREVYTQNWLCDESVSFLEWSTYSLDII